jgi:thiamine-monophosphate kinase
MGAEPAWTTLALSLPEADEAFAEGFAHGFFSLAAKHDVELVGGDTVRGPLQVVVQAQGILPEGSALKRSGARPGDQIFVTGTLGDAGAGLALQQQQCHCEGEAATFLRHRLDYPVPRVAEGIALRGIASAAIDISDGLLADLGHILAASGVGARLAIDALPLSPALRQCQADEAARLKWALGAGDDYELCFTVPAERIVAFERVAADWGCGYSRIGEICDEPGLGIEQGTLPPGVAGGFDHFGGRG